MEKRPMLHRSLSSNLVPILGFTVLVAIIAACSSNDANDHQPTGQPHPDATEARGPYCTALAECCPRVDPAFRGSCEGMARGGTEGPEAAEEVCKMQLPVFASICPELAEPESPVLEDAGGEDAATAVEDPGLTEEAKACVLKERLSCMACCTDPAKFPGFVVFKNTVRKCTCESCMQACADTPYCKGMSMTAQGPCLDCELDNASVCEAAAMAACGKVESCMAAVACLKAC